MIKRVIIGVHQGLSLFQESCSRLLIMEYYFE
jgi:hypothetical protein